MNLAYLTDIIILLMAALLSDTLATFRTWPTPVIHASEIRA